MKTYAPHPDRDHEEPLQTGYARRMISTTKTLTRSFREFSEDDALTLSAALAFYTALSLAPLLLVLLWVASLLGEGTQQQLVAQLQQVVGPQASAVIGTVVENARSRPSAASVAGLVSLIAVLFSAAGVFAQLQHALNVVWNVQPSTQEGGTWGWIKKRLLSMGMVLLFGILLIASIVASTVLTTLTSSLQGIVPGASILWYMLDAALSLALFTVLFAAIFKVLPDAKTAWRDVWWGAFATALLFAIGKVLVGFYLGYSSFGSTFGAAGSLLALLVWVYYSSTIFLFGAELTRVHQKQRSETEDTPTR